MRCEQFFGDAGHVIGVHHPELFDLLLDGHDLLEQHTHFVAGLEIREDQDVLLGEGDPAIVDPLVESELAGGVRLVEILFDFLDRFFRGGHVSALHLLDRPIWCSKTPGQEGRLLTGGREPTAAVRG